MGNGIFELLKGFKLFESTRDGYQKLYYTVSILSFVAIVIAIDTLYSNFIEGLTTKEEEPKEVSPLIMI